MFNVDYFDYHVDYGNCQENCHNDKYKNDKIEFHDAEDDDDSISIKMSYYNLKVFVLKTLDSKSFSKFLFIINFHYVL